jgi:hypothetical protein
VEIKVDLGLGLGSSSSTVCMIFIVLFALSTLKIARFSFLYLKSETQGDDW